MYPAFDKTGRGVCVIPQGVQVGSTHEYPRRLLQAYNFRPAPLNPILVPKLCTMGACGVHMTMPRRQRPNGAQQQRYRMSQVYGAAILAGGHKSWLTLHPSS